MCVAARSSPELEVGEEEARGFRRLLAAEAPKPAPGAATLFSKAAIDPNRGVTSMFLTPPTFFELFQLSF